MSTFKAGDVVRLKSGGIKMTVYYADSDSVDVMYFNDQTNSIVKCQKLQPEAFELSS